MQTTKQCNQPNNQTTKPPDNKMKKNIKYEEAVAELQDIVTKMENGSLDIDKMCEELKKAQQLIAICKDKLTKTEEEIAKILEK